jgi:pimeloyl-ACP methyl ester carboxylesterase
LKNRNGRTRCATRPARCCSPPCPRSGSLPDAAHLPSIECPEVVTAELLAFLDSARV